MPAISVESVFNLDIRLITWCDRNNISYTVGVQIVNNFYTGGNKKYDEKGLLIIQSGAMDKAYDAYMDEKQDTRDQLRYLSTVKSRVKNTLKSLAFKKLSSVNTTAEFEALSRELKELEAKERELIQKARREYSSDKTMLNIPDELVENGFKTPEELNIRDLNKSSRVKRNLITTPTAAAPPPTPPSATTSSTEPPALWYRV